MPLKAYEDFAPGPLEFPIRGKVYTVGEIPWDRGLKLRDILNGDAEATPEEQNRLLLGDAYDEMVADNAPAAAVSRAVLAALTDFRLGRETAERVWESGLSPEALAPTSGATAGSTSTGAESSTPTPDSSSGTNSQTGTSKAKGVRAKASPSRKSSSSGH